jgi:hypothetical protein
MTKEESKKVYRQAMAESAELMRQCAARKAEREAERKAR